MVSAYLADALRDPSSELQELFTSASSSATDFPQLVANHFSRVFRTDDAFQQIPVLNLKNPPEAHPHRSLVRFRGMVQDTSPSSEMYLYKSPDGKVGGWGIEMEIVDEQRHEVDFANLRETTILWVTSIPGETRWFAECVEGPDSDGIKQIHVPVRPHKFHIQDAHLGVQVKLYGDSGTNLKSTDVVTFVGILASDHLNTDIDNPPTVPTLHVLYIREQSEVPPSLTSPPEGEQLRLARGELLRWIADEALGGDQEAAEWVLFTIIARVQTRYPPLLPPCITLSRFPSPPNHLPDATPALSHALSLILPQLVTLPLSLQLLNERTFAPESKEEDLHAGSLQLPKGTVLLITENGVSEGKLHEKGLVNVQALQEIMLSQTLAYNFPFSRFSFPTDIACLVIAEGKKSAFFKTDILFPLRSEPAYSTAEVLYKPEVQVRKPPEEQLRAFRYLVYAARMGKVQVGEGTSEYIQQDFVQERQNNKAITSEDLIRWMTIAKLRALSFQRTELSVDDWEQTKLLDQKRIARLAS